MSGTGEPARLPSFYNDLDGTLAESWRLIARGMADRRSPFHHPTLATLGVNLINQGMKSNLNKSFLHIIWMSVEVERFAVAHIVQLAVSSFPIIDAIEEVIDLFDASFEKVSIVFAEGLVTDFEVLFHRFYIAFLDWFRQLLFLHRFLVDAFHLVSVSLKSSDGLGRGILKVLACLVEVCD